MAQRGTRFRAVIRITGICAILGAATTVAVAWTLPLLTPRVALNARDPGDARGIAVVDGLIVFVIRAHHASVRTEMWNIRDPNDGIWDATKQRWRAIDIQEMGGAAYDLMQAGSSNPLFDRADVARASRLEGLISRGIPRSILDGPPDPGGSIIMIRCYGWPFPALSFTHRVSFQVRTNPNGARQQVKVFRSAIQLPDPRGRATGGERILPMRPLVTGMAADVSLHAFAWSVLLFLPGLLRRRHRLRRARCPRCGYDLRATPGSPCPECGSEAPLARC